MHQLKLLIFIQIKQVPNLFFGVQPAIILHLSGSHSIPDEGNLGAFSEKGR